MKHKNYYEIKADNYFDLWIKKWQLFRSELKNSIIKKKKIVDWNSIITKSKNHLNITKENFPNLIE